MLTGGYTIEVRHRGGKTPCPKAAAKTARCKCTPSFRAKVWDPVERKRASGPWTKDRDSAVDWAVDWMVNQREGTRVTSGVSTVREAGDWLFDGIDAGRIFSRSKTGGERNTFKPGTVRGYKQVWRDHVLPEIGNETVAGLRRPLVQNLIWTLWAGGPDSDGLSASTVRNAVIPLRVLFRELRRAEIVTYNPTHDLDLPPGIGKRERVLELEDATRTLGVLADEDRPIWATALYAGMRHGELKALAVENVNLTEGFIEVEDSWDQYEGLVGPKSAAGRRRVPIVAALEPHLGEALARRRTGLLFGRGPSLPFQSNRLQGRADTAWRKAGLDRWTLHELRHSFVSHAYMAGVLPKTIQEWAGHSSLQFTLDYYTHLTVRHHRRESETLSTYFDARHS